MQRAPASPASASPCRRLPSAAGPPRRCRYSARHPLHSLLPPPLRQPFLCLDLRERLVQPLGLRRLKAPLPLPPLRGVYGRLPVRRGQPHQPAHDGRPQREDAQPLHPLPELRARLALRPHECRLDDVRRRLPELPCERAQLTLHPRDQNCPITLRLLHRLLVIPLEALARLGGLGGRPRQPLG